MSVDGFCYVCVIPWSKFLEAYEASNLAAALENAQDPPTIKPLGQQFLDSLHELDEIDTLELDELALMEAIDENSRRKSLLTANELDLYRKLLEPFQLGGDDDCTAIAPLDLPTKLQGVAKMLWIHAAMDPARCQDLLSQAESTSLFEHLLALEKSGELEMPFAGDALQIYESLKYAVSKGHGILAYSWAS